MGSEIKTNSSEILRFGSIRYDTKTGELNSDGATQPTLRRQSSDVLSILAKNVGTMVDKETLIESVWSGVSTTDDSLVQCIVDIRRVLGREAIDTFPKKGYRLNAIAESTTNPEREHTNNRPWWLAAFATIAFFAVAATYSFVPHRSAHNQSLAVPVDSQGKSLAVLPFTDLGSDPGTSYFSSGLGEDLTTDLSQIDGLTVISYASSLGYADMESGFRSIAEELGADYLVRGTVRQQGRQLRINVSLVNSDDGFNIWSKRYDRSADDPFDVQSEVTREVTQALALTLSTKPNQRSINTDARKMLLRGVERQREATPLAYEEARVYFNRALAFDPDYARAHASIAATYGRSAMLNSTAENKKGDIDNGLRSAVAAIQIDPELPLAYYSVGLLNLVLKDFEKALSAARHAIELDSNFADGYALLAELSFLGGDLNEALYSIRRAKLLHPHHPPSYTWIEGSILFQLNRFGDATKFLAEAVELSPSFNPALVTLAANHVNLGEIDKARSLLKKVKQEDESFSYQATVEQISFNLLQRKNALLDGLSKIN